MLVPKSELRYDFKGAQFDFNSERDRKLLAWIFNQFLYGEATGIQCGYWLYHAPSIQAATFLAKQAGEEFAHFRKILRIFSILEQKPALAHWAVRFLATGMMGGSWGIHVALEMALGEGMVLTVFYALVDTIPQTEIQKLIDTSIVEEERHVEFGERETLQWLKAHPGGRPFVLGQALVQVIVLKKLKNFISKRVLDETGPDHPVMKQFGEFYDHAIRQLEVRMERLGISTVPLSQLGRWEKVWLLGSLPFRMIVEKIKPKPALITSTYLRDLTLINEEKRAPL